MDLDDDIPKVSFKIEDQLASVQQKLTSTVMIPYDLYCSVTTVGRPQKLLRAAAACAQGRNGQDHGQGQKAQGRPRLNVSFHLVGRSCAIKTISHCSKVRERTIETRTCLGSVQEVRKCHVDVEGNDQPQHCCATSERALKLCVAFYSIEAMLPAHSQFLVRFSINGEFRQHGPLECSRCSRLLLDHGGC